MKALKATKGSDLQAALDWIEAHGDDPNIDEPLKEEEEAAEGEANEEESMTGNNCLKCNDCGKKFTSVMFAQLHASKTGHEDFAETTEAIPVLTEEEKRERLQELKQKLAEKRRLDALKAEEEQRQNEIIRRKASKDTAEYKKQLEEKEMQKDLERRLREKEEDKQQRARIKAQIEEDRQRMKEKAEAEKLRAQGIPGQKADLTPAAPLVMEQSSIKSDTARLHIRLPDGKALRETIDATKTLGDLMSLVEEKSGFPSSNYGLMIALPPRSFEVSTEGSKTMQELGLCPSAALVLRKI